jgi:signal transduction histidine kinase
MPYRSIYIGISHRLSRRLFPLAVAAGMLIALVSPVTYWVIEQGSLQHMASMHAEDLATRLQVVALDAPELWKYQSRKFMNISKDFHPGIDLIGFGVLDEKGDVVSGYESDPSWRKYGRALTLREELFTTLGTAPILFNNRKLGTIEVLVSDSRLIRRTILIFCISTLAGMALSSLIYLFPTRVVRDLECEIRELIAGLHESDDEVRRLNAGLEKMVESKTHQLLAAQEELVRKEKLAILGQLSGSVGHELRNPLGVISNAVYFLKMVHTNSDEKTKEYLDIIKQEIDNSQRIITDLLDFARTRTPLTRAISVWGLLDNSFGKCVIPDSIDLQIGIPDTLPLLKVDPLQMEQVFQNLITNAVQAMHNCGALRISGEHRFEEGLESGDFVSISIDDTGEGILPENMNKLFQPLFTTKAKGIGLGLVVCRNLVEANGGRIEVKSLPGEGTTFTVMLPVKEE